MPRGVLRQYSKSQLEQVVRLATLKQAAAQAEVGRLRRVRVRTVVLAALAGFLGGLAASYGLWP